MGHSSSMTYVYTSGLAGIWSSFCIICCGISTMFIGGKKIITGCLGLRLRGIFHKANFKVMQHEHLVRRTYCFKFKPARFVGFKWAIQLWQTPVIFCIVFYSLVTLVKKYFNFHFQFSVFSFQFSVFSMSFQDTNKK